MPPLDTIITAPHKPISSTVPDTVAVTTENKMSVRQLIDGQEYPVIKCDIIKKGFDHTAAVER